MDITANCICEIHSLALDVFNLNTDHELSSKEINFQREKILTEPGIEHMAAGREAGMLPQCYNPPLR